MLETILKKNKFIQAITVASILTCPLVANAERPSQYQNNALLEKYNLEIDDFTRYQPKIKTLSGYHFNFNTPRFDATIAYNGQSEEEDEKKPKEEETPTEDAPVEETTSATRPDYLPTTERETSDRKAYYVEPSTEILDPNREEDFPIKKPKSDFSIREDYFSEQNNDFTTKSTTSKKNTGGYVVMIAGGIGAALLSATLTTYKTSAVEGTHPAVYAGYGGIGLGSLVTIGGIIGLISESNKD